MSRIRSVSYRIHTKLVFRIRNSVLRIRISGSVSNIFGSETLRVKCTLCERNVVTKQSLFSPVFGKLCPVYKAYGRRCFPRKELAIYLLYRKSRVRLLYVTVKKYPLFKKSTLISRVLYFTLHFFCANLL
jgi:hypothetical protein